ncbi:hypothetical protein NL676_026032 [Syzygium grande]|nr:hypothetical protein NL676_026032 [Syzygium grande]
MENGLPSALHQHVIMQCVRSSGYPRLVSGQARPSPANKEGKEVEHEPGAPAADEVELGEHGHGPSDGGAKRAGAGPDDEGEGAGGVEGGVEVEGELLGLAGDDAGLEGEAEDAEGDHGAGGPSSSYWVSGRRGRRMENGKILKGQFIDWHAPASSRIEYVLIRLDEGVIG